MCGVLITPVHFQQLFTIPSFNCTMAQALPVGQRPLEDSFRATSTNTSSPYASGLHLLSRVQEYINKIEPDAAKHRLTVQKWYVLSQRWNSLKLALIATGEVADKAKALSDKQRAQYHNYANRCFRTAALRTRQANASLRLFRHVTALSRHALTIQHRHESKLQSYHNLQEHYESALGPHTDGIHTYQRFLRDLRRRIEQVKMFHGLENVNIRWLQMRASTDLKKESRKFHLTRMRLRFWGRRVEITGKRGSRLLIEAAKRTEDYQHLDREFRSKMRAIHALWVTSRSNNRSDAGVSASTQNGSTE